MEDRAAERLAEVRAVAGRARLVRVGGEPDLVVAHNVDSAALRGGGGGGEVLVVGGGGGVGGQVLAVLVVLLVGVGEGGCYS